MLHRVTFTTNGIIMAYTIKSHLGAFMGRNKHKLVDVADATGLNRSTITKIYNDKITRIDADALSRLCLLYKCQPGDLLYFDNDGSIELPDAEQAKKARIEAVQQQKKNQQKSN